MIFVDLPLIDIRGEWDVNDRERALARLLVAALPAAPPPGSDVVIRWNTAMATLCAVRDHVRDHGSTLFADGQTAIATTSGSVSLMDMGFKTARAVIAGDFWVGLLRTGNKKHRAAVAGYLDKLEPEVAALRGHLAEAADETP